tara:strand:- start:14579 stop:14923 length:345 start_codon:yes stop_codon:yes gene_type:complete
MKKSQFKKIVLYGLAAGLYPIIFFYTNNFSLINSWRHFTFFIGLFLIAPICLFLGIQLMSFLPSIKKLQPALFSYLSENNSYIENLQEDATYTIITEGVYECMNSTGKIVFRKR